MKTTHQKTKKITQTIQDIEQTRSETTDTNKGLQSTLTDLQQLIGQDDNNLLGQKLIKTGTFLVVAVPEPVVSDLTGTALIAAGLTMNKLTQKTTIKDVCTNLKQAIQDVNRVKREISHITLD